jgi:excisionase family DNA binding protein
VEDAAKYAGVTVRYVKGLLQTHKITPVRAGKTTLIDRYDVDAHLEKLKGVGTT